MPVIYLILSKTPSKCTANRLETAQNPTYINSTIIYPLAIVFYINSTVIYRQLTPTVGLPIAIVGHAALLCTRSSMMFQVANTIVARAKASVAKPMAIVSKPMTIVAFAARNVGKPMTTFAEPIAIVNKPMTIASLPMRTTRNPIMSNFPAKAAA